MGTGILLFAVVCSDCFDRRPASASAGLAFMLYFALPPSVANDCNNLLSSGLSAFGDLFYLTAAGKVPPLPFACYALAWYAAWRCLRRGDFQALTRPSAGLDVASPPKQATMNDERQYLKRIITGSRNVNGAQLEVRGFLRHFPPWRHQKPHQVLGSYMVFAEFHK